MSRPDLPPLSFACLTFLLAVGLPVVGASTAACALDPSTCISTVVGTMGRKSASSLNFPVSVLVGNDGSLIVACSPLQDGWIASYSGGSAVVIAGGGSLSTFPPGPALFRASAARLLPSYVSLAFDGSYFESDWAANVILRVGLDGLARVVAGDPTASGADCPGLCGDGGPATKATLISPAGTAFHPITRDLYLVDSYNHVVRAVIDGIITSVAGDIVAGSTNGGDFGGDGGPATAALLSYPSAIAFNGDGSVMYITDGGNNLVRAVSFSASGNTIQTVAGNYSATLADGFGDGGLATRAFLGNQLPDVKVDASSGDYFIVDATNCAIRKVRFSTGIISTVAGTIGACGNTGDGGTATLARLYSPQSIALVNGNQLYIADGFNNAIRSVGEDGIIRALVGGLVSRGAGLTGSGLDGELGVNVNINYPLAVAFDKAGNLFFNDFTNAVYVVEVATGVIKTVAGTRGVPGCSGDGGAATSATMTTPGDGGAYTPVVLTGGLAVDQNNGDVYVSDTYCHAVRRINATSGIIQTVVGTLGVSTDVSSNILSGDGYEAWNATLHFPCGLALDSNGNLFISDTANSVIRFVSSATGIISSIAGVLGQFGAGGDNGPATLAAFNAPLGLALDETTWGHPVLYVADTGNGAIRRLNITASGTTVSTVTGSLGLVSVSPEGDEGPVTAATFNSPRAVALDASGNLYIADTNSAFADANVNVVRVVSYSSSSHALGNVPTRFAGSKSAEAGSDGDEGPATAASLSTPQCLAFWGGAVYICDGNNNAIRTVPLSSPTQCPAGFSCDIGRNLKGCYNVTAFCPNNVRYPYPVDAGYAAVTTYSNAVGLNVTVSQVYCPVGSFCPVQHAGVAIPCYPGSYGVHQLQTTPSQCSACPAMTYLAEAGVSQPAPAVGSAAGAPCLRCPGGAFASSPGAAFCALCMPGTFLDNLSSSGGSGHAAANCSACPDGAFSLFGQSRCTAAQLPSPVATITYDPIGQAAVFQRILTFTNGNASPAQLLSTLLAVTLPVAIVALLPTLLFFLFSVPAISRLCDGLCGSDPTAGCRGTVAAILTSLDLFKVRPPRKAGQTFAFEPSTFGGVISIASLGLMLCLMLTVVVNFALANTALQQALVPLSSAVLTSYHDLPYAQTDPSVGIGLTDPALTILTGDGSTPGGTGFVVTVATMGALCGSIVGKPLANVRMGGFNYSRSVEASTGAALHFFACPSCIITDLGSIKLQFDASCQSFAVTLAAASVSGSLSSSTFYISNAAAPGQPPMASITSVMPIVLDVVQDDVYGNPPRAGDGLVVGGRSKVGFLISSSPYSVVAVPATTASPASGATVSLYINIALDPNHLRYTLSPIIPIVSLLSAIMAFAGVVGVGAIPMGIRDGIKESHLEAEKKRHEEEERQRAAAIAAEEEGGGGGKEHGHAEIELGDGEVDDNDDDEEEGGGEEAGKEEEDAAAEGEADGHDTVELQKHEFLRQLRQPSHH